MVEDEVLNWEDFANKPTDSHNTKVLKHAYRWGVKHGAIDPYSESGKKLWQDISSESAADEIE